LEGLGMTPHEADFSVRKFAALRVGPQYAMTKTSFESHSAMHVATAQDTRRTRTAEAGPGGPAGP
jgi:hypothetical protein